VPWSNQPLGRGRGGMMMRPMSFMLLTDAEGQVIYGNPAIDPDGVRKGQSVEIIAGGVVVGRLSSAAPGLVDLGPLEQGFLTRMRNYMILAAGLAAGLGLALGVVFSRNLAAPLRRLATAARAVAGGDLSQKVDESGSAELVEVARSFNEMTGALQHAETLRQNLMADVAHELRTPLTVVQGNLQAILDDVYPLQRSEVAKVYDETRLLSRLVDDLRELALAEAGQLQVDVRPTNIGELVESSVAMFSLVAEEKTIGLSVHLTEDMPFALADPDRFAQVLNNLLSNALRHTPTGGQIVVSASATGEADRVTVRDDGEGISAEDLPRVFDRFWRADRSRARESGGSGLGLTIARQLMKAQGGNIGVVSDPGQGSVFWIELPTAESVVAL
jgi:two-component system OmpR family sensor kinase